MERASLYERAGGESVVRPAVALFYQRVLADPVLAGYFDGVDLARLRAHQRAFVAAALGGPELFVGRSLEVAHRDLRIDDAAFDAMVEHLVGALRDLGTDDSAAAEVAEQLLVLRSKVVG